MNFPTLPYDHVTNSFLLEICFWGPTYPTFLYDVTLFSLFFFELFPNSHLMEISMKLLVKRDTKVVVKTSITEMLEGNICLLFLPLLLLTFCEYDAVQEEGQKTL